jgi:hypothetical protein
VRSWWVRLSGRPSDLQRLRELFDSGDPNVLEEDGSYFLRAAGFAAWSQPEEIRLHADRLLTCMNGIAGISASHYQPVQVEGEVIEFDQGTTRRHLSVTAKLELRWAIEGPTRPAPHEAGRWLALAQQDQDVADALRFLVAPDWFNLYKVYEIIKKDVGGQKPLQQMAPKLAAGLRQFIATANHPSLLGDRARHARTEGSPNMTPMALAEAQQLVWALLEQWLSSKR